jgi:hypothetical protein
MVRMPDEYVHPFVESGVLRICDAVVEKLREYAREHPLWPRDVPRLPTISWNVAALPAPIGEWSGWIISAIFLSESGERIARTVVGKRSG